MTPNEYRDFLLGGARTAKLATVRGDGRPHVAPVWFALDDDQFVFTTWHATVKAANLRRDGRVSLCIDEEAPSFDFVIVEGTASVGDEAPACSVGRRASRGGTSGRTGPGSTGGATASPASC